MKEAKRFLNGEDTGATVSQPFDIKALRNKFNLSQSKFAKSFGININTLKNWEHGTRSMDNTAVTFFKVIEKYPDIVKQVVNDNCLYE